MKKPTRLQLIVARDRYAARARDSGPQGGTLEHWLAYREWVDARRGEYDAAIKAARPIKREEPK